MVAASEAPPPRPPAAGMRFMIEMWNGSGSRPRAPASASTARHARLPKSAGAPSAKGPVTSIEGVLDGCNATSSASARVWRMLASS